MRSSRLRKTLRSSSARVGIAITAGVPDNQAVLDLVWAYLLPAMDDPADPGRLPV